MKKIIKYELSKDSLEEDIDKFIKKAKRGNFAWDSKYENEGLKIIKAYFRMIQEKFNKNEYDECKNCYYKLILFLFDSSRGDNKADFGYTDLLAKISNNFDKFIRNYFICLVKTCKPEELLEKVLEYIIKLKEYNFDSDKEILLSDLDKEKLEKLEEKMLEKTQGITKKDFDKQDILYFLIHLAGSQKNKDKYIKLCNQFKGIINEKELRYLKEDYKEYG